MKVAQQKKTQTFFTVHCQKVICSHGTSNFHVWNSFQFLNQASIFLKCSPLEHHLTSHAPWPHRQQMCKHVSMQGCMRSKLYREYTVQELIVALRHTDSVVSCLISFYPSCPPLLPHQRDWMVLLLNRLKSIESSGRKPLRPLQNMYIDHSSHSGCLKDPERTPSPRDSLRKVNLYFLKVNRYAVPSFITKVQHTWAENRR